MFAPDKLKLLIPTSSMRITLLLFIIFFIPSTSIATNLNQYSKIQGLSPLVDTPATKLVGITYNAQLKQYITLHNGNNLSNVLDENFNFIKQINNNANGNDHEDLLYIGKTANNQHEYAVVDEYGRLFLGAFTPDTGFNYKQFQTITYSAGPQLKNYGGEGLAYNAASDTFYVCVEGRYHTDPDKFSPMKIYQFARPATQADISYLDSGLTVTELFDAELKLRPYIADISSCYFNNQTQSLIILSQISEKVIEVDLSNFSISLCKT
ncbi:SdiA-regulated domain-containing protein [sulfur-oxidizing endosymbiont of Gigantopelta aegis]|uniref:SdiA-regulated domain-containing protein n=1 Tax=sulfur-oxidizing endosymbiont of Gigantopelta aegis TaxID=2794934 RepID=UPI0018DBE921|nr:SdiA-regulated domain-containing protein [sulfur-oxidizing endosymbiont of Gigantopelta aegis]